MECKSVRELDQAGRKNNCTREELEQREPFEAPAAGESVVRRTSSRAAVRSGRASFIVVWSPKSKVNVSRVAPPSAGSIEYDIVAYDGDVADIQRTFMFLVARLPASPLCR